MDYTDFGSRHRPCAGDARGRPTYPRHPRAVSRSMGVPFTFPFTFEGFRQWRLSRGLPRGWTVEVSPS